MSIFEQALHEINTTIQLECSNDCVDVIDKIEHFTPDLIFLDLHLPMKDGLDCLGEIHNTLTLRSIPVVMYTGSITPAEVERAAAMGAKLFFEKPSSYRELALHLQEVLNMEWHLPESIQPAVIKDGQLIAMQEYLEGANKR